MPRSMLGGQHKRTIEKQKRLEAEAEMVTPGESTMAWDDPKPEGESFNISDLSYNELRAFAKDRDIDATGKKDEILARIEVHFHGE